MQSTVNGSHELFAPDARTCRSPSDRADVQMLLPMRVCRAVRPLAMLALDPSVRSLGQVEVEQIGEVAGVPDDIEKAVDGLGRCDAGALELLRDLGQLFDEEEPMLFSPSVTPSPSMEVQGVLLDITQSWWAHAQVPLRLGASAWALDP